MKKKVFVTLGLGVGLFWLAPAAQASLVFYLGGCDFTDETGGSGACGGTGADLPNGAVIMTFDDLGGGHVQLTIAANDIPDGSKIDKVWFNVNSGLTFGNLDFNPVPALSTAPAATPGAGGKVKNAGIFDIVFDYTQKNGNKFDPGEKSVHDILGSGLTENSFNEWSKDGLKSYLAAFHLNVTENSSKGAKMSLQLNNTGNSDSGDYGATPAPATLLLFGSGLFGLAAVGRKRKNEQ